MSQDGGVDGGETINPIRPEYIIPRFFDNFTERPGREVSSCNELRTKIRQRPGGMLQPANWTSLLLANTRPEFESQFLRPKPCHKITQVGSQAIGEFLHSLPFQQVLQPPESAASTHKKDEPPHASIAVHRDFEASTEYA